MNFNSIEFLIFFPIVALAYFIMPRKIKNLWLLIASYYFYMCWNASYALLIFFSTASTYLCGYLIEIFNEPKKRKLALAVNIIVNLGILFYFKYYNFFGESITAMFNNFGIDYTYSASSVLLPVGISFYTFQALGYSIDVYRKDLKHERNFLNYALFVSFFPQLVAGPIERATNLLPQFKKTYKFDRIRVESGLRQMLWGFFKKVVISNGCEILVKNVYATPQDYDGLALVLATFFFAFQIYCDFSGYSDIAIGAARVIGFDLMRNFDSPYFSQSIPEFWRRWHISLSTWFKDYLYIPLGGNRCSKPRRAFNLFITMLTSGLWHGANWTYVLWGAYHGILNVLSILTVDIRKKVRNTCKIDKIPFFPALFRILFTFYLVCIGWVLFCSSSISKASYILKNMHSNIFATLSDTALRTASLESMGFSANNGMIMLIAIAFLLICELIEKRRPFMEVVGKSNIVIRFAVYYLLIFALLFFGGFGASTFIYFQF